MALSAKHDYVWLLSRSGRYRLGGQFEWKTVEDPPKKFTLHSDYLDQRFYDNGSGTALSSDVSLDGAYIAETDPPLILEGNNGDAALISADGSVTRVLLTSGKAGSGAGGAAIIMGINGWRANKHFQLLAGDGLWQNGRIIPLGPLIAGNTLDETGSVINGYDYPEWGDINDEGVIAGNFYEYVNENPACGGSGVGSQA